LQATGNPLNNFDQTFVGLKIAVDVKHDKCPVTHESEASMAMFLSVRKYGFSSPVK
jgi:hypothetical protein